MKKKIFLLSITILLLQSCSPGDNPNSSGDPLLKEIVSTDGHSTKYTYNGNKLSKVIGHNGSSTTFTNTYTYVGDLITEIKGNYNFGSSSLGFVQNFYYSDNKLTKTTFADNSSPDSPVQTDYVYNIDGTVTATSITTTSLTPDSPGSDIVKFYYSNGNIVKTEHDGKTETFTYDEKNSPMRNIAGFFKIQPGISGFPICTNNILTIQNAIFSDFSNTTYSYEYNSQGYPISCTETIDGKEPSTDHYTYY